MRGKRKAEGGSRSAGRRESERDPWPGGADRKYCRSVNTATRLLWPAQIYTLCCAEQAAVCQQNASPSLVHGHSAPQ